MKLPLVLVLVCSYIALAGCAPRVYVEQDSNAKFSGLHSFAWVSPPIGKIKNPILDSQIFADRVQQAVVANLTSRGFSQADSQQDADFIVTYHIVSKTQLQSSGPSFSFGFFGVSPNTFGSVAVPVGSNVQTVEQGTLMLDIINRRDQHLLWRGWTNETVNQDNYSAQAISKTVNAILAKFPPGSAT
ncbi:MAG: DUF4136 domain-containing protein [Gammaproteobacteria bacterium]|nr:DUF4136 domain-containing protein [Gammaproteobacteria bacterium]MDE2345736.1 DUF4136 domain-containing protein [Gammaproteobacteria bacterium]